MDVDPEDRRYLAEINVVPLVDVVLVLLIIFMITAPLLYRGIDIQLPPSQTNTITPDERLVVTVFRDDEEALALWTQDMGLDPDRVLRMGEKTNLWMMADVGPCGPTTEIHYDFFPERGAGWRVGYDEDRFLEIWNHVFMAFDRDENGTLTPLPMKSVDTGPGGAECVNPFAYWVNKKGLKAVRCLGTDQSFSVKGVELGMHGHRGPNGARGTLKSFSTIGVKSITGHSHTPGIENGAYQAGTSTSLRRWESQIAMANIPFRCSTKDSPYSS